MFNEMTLDRLHLRWVLALVAVVFFSLTAGSALAAGTPSEKISAGEQRKIDDLSMRDVSREADPMSAPTQKPLESGELRRERPDGPVQRIEGAAPSGVSGARGAASITAGRIAQNGAWPGSYASNPNRQVGKLYFDVQPGAGTRWNVCSGTAVNSENKSMIVTAGHCVFTPDPDGNRRVTGNGYWYENFVFCPGYEYGCKLGSWGYRRVSTTSSWFYGSSGQYDARDDVAVILTKPNNRGNLVNAVGGQGIQFNAAVGLRRYAMGYPAYDTRWPQYNYNGEDLMYCNAVSSNSPISGMMRIPCTMTGGSSGGPWITSPNSSWFGYVNSVNSHKYGGGPSMDGPYFGAAEQSLYQRWRAA